jgi:hypothetical protein
MIQFNQALKTENITKTPEENQKTKLSSLNLVTSEIYFG